MKSGGEPGDLLGKRASIVLLATYAVGLVALPFLLDPIRPYLQSHTETPAEASDAFIVICCIAAGVVPLILTPFIVLWRLVTRHRARRRITRGVGLDLRHR